MSEPPPLPPAGAPPWTVLAVPEDADPAEIRRAYARLIKHYRPDRAPAEFQRIHAAFLALGRGERPAGAEPPAPAATTDVSSPPEVSPAAARISPELAERLAALAQAGTDADSFGPAWRAALATPGAQLDQIVAVLDRAQHAQVPTLADWPTLRPHADRHPGMVAALLLRGACLANFDGDPATACAALGDPSFARHAAADPNLAEAGLRIAIAAAWRQPEHDAAPWLAMPGEFGLEHLQDELSAALIAARTWRASRPIPAPVRALRQGGEGETLPLALVHLLCDSALLGRSGWADVSASLEPALLSGALLPACDHLVGLGLDAALEDCLAAATPRPGRGVGELEPDAFAQLGAELTGFAQHLGRGGVAGVVWTGVSSLVRMRDHYRRTARVGFARIIGELGVPLHAAVGWLRLNGKLARRAALFHLVLEHDPGMRLLGAIADRLHHGRR